MSDFYTNISVAGKYILFRGVESGKRVQRRVEYKPTFFLPSQEQTEYTTLDGKFVKPVQPGTIPECRDFLERYKDVSNFPIYGNNRYEYAFISDKYPEDILWDINKVLIANIDIEVGSENGFPEPNLASEEITAITIRLKGNYFVFGCGEYTKHRDDVHYAKCNDEQDLIKRFIEFWTRFHPDIVTGWNIEGFDIPYIINRIVKLFGEEEAKRLSPWGKISPYSMTFYDKEVHSYNILGVSVLDYIALYRKFTYTQQENYQLDTIANVELGERKLDYSEYESLHQLYKHDYQKFVEYNIRDVELVDRLEDKLRLIELALTLAYDNKVNYDDVFTQVRMWDAIVYNYLRRKNVVIPQMKRGEKSSAYEGAYVKDPVPGLYECVVSFDLDSLYPHLIMQYNISMETLIDSNSPLYSKLREQNISVDDLLHQRVDTSFLKDNQVTLTPNGQLFSTKSQGVMAEIMETMYKDRKRYKKLALEAESKKESVLEDNNQVEYLENQIVRYNNLQLAKKVTLNSAYGAMGNQYFRFFDIRIAEAITTSGQLSTRWIEKELNQYMNNLLKTKEIDYVIASDTDSIYLHLHDIVKKVYGEDWKSKNSAAEIIEFMDKVCSQKIQPFIDSSYQKLADYTNAYAQMMRMKREVLADRAIWVAAKNYIVNVHNSEGVAYAKPKLKMKGISAVRSSIPTVCREKIKQAINIMITQTEEDLHEFIEQFKKEFKTLSPDKIAFPRGLSGLEDYACSTSVYSKGAPIHVKGALVYNHFLDRLNLTKQYKKIRDGDKIKFLHLKTRNIFNNNTLAFLNVIPKEFGAEEYIDYDLQFQKSFIDPLVIILDTINWKTEKTESLEDFFA